METRVCKFGGTSLADAAAIKRVVRLLRNEDRRYILPSAPGKRFDADEKTTDVLYAIFDAKRRGDGDEVRKLFQGLEQRFQTLAQPFGLGAFAGELLLEQKRLLKGEVSRDFLASRGEYVTARLLAKILDLPFFDGADYIVIGENGRVDGVSYEKLRAALKNEKRAVVSAFYGRDKAGLIKTFPRGGGDISGAVVARAAKADVYENWTDVDGVYAADPKIVRQPKKIRSLSYEQLNVLSLFGSNVFCGAAILPLVGTGIPVLVKNTFCPNRAGTLVCEKSVSNDKIVGIAAKKESEKGLLLLAAVGKADVCKRLQACLQKGGERVAFCVRRDDEASVVAVRTKNENKCVYLAYRELFE